MLKINLNKFCVPFFILPLLFYQTFLISALITNGNNLTDNVTIVKKNSIMPQALSSKKEIKKALTEIDYNNESSKIIAKFDFSVLNDETYQEIALKRSKCMTQEDIECFREEISNYTFDYHKNLLNQYIDNYNIKNAKIINYSPYILLSYNSIAEASDNIFKISQISEIESIEIIENLSSDSEDEKNIYEPSPETTFEMVLSQINAYSIVSNSSYTGNGVKIGIYEANGVANPNMFQGRNIVYKTGSGDLYQTYTFHASEVTSVFFGIAPNATVYMSPTDQVGIEWFIDNRVSVVNCSFGLINAYPNGDGTYSPNYSVGYKTSIDGIYDYQICSNYINVINSAGNRETDNTSDAYNPDSYITSPAYARNVITVGGVSGTSISPLSHASGAAYVNKDGYAKPNISAQFTVTAPNGYTLSGTSLAAPQVTGSVALLLESQPYLSVYPEQLAAALEASSNHEILNDFSPNSDLANHDDENGAGVLDVDNLINSVTITEKHLNNNNLQGHNVLSEKVHLNAGQKIKISLFWLARFDKNNENLYYTNYDLHLSFSGSILSSSNSIYCNNELIMFTAPSTGDYTINAYQTGPYQGTGYDFIGLAYRIY